MRGAAAVTAVLSGAFCLALVGLVVARDVTTFLAFWELMTLLPASVIFVVRHDEQARRDVFAYLAITHLGGIGVWVSMLVLADHGALSGTPLHPTASRALVAVAAVLGFGTKAGAMPLHSWLPRAHPLAPAHVSSLMSGVMIKLALYGLIRVLFEWAAPMPQWVGLTLLGIGALSAVGGVLYALFQHELKRLLAFHSIENVGIIVLGLGASLVFASIGRRSGARSRSRQRCCTRSTMPCSRRCCSWVRGRSRARSEGSSSIAWGDCCVACRGPRARSRSGRWRSPGCRRSTASRRSG